ncbi:MAG: cytochrome c biogenesis protein ResB [Acidobacteriota bacterium]|nr:cytochrome c biogenesis protein ResB [Acidobacteriota bacterium]
MLKRALIFLSRAEIFTFACAWLIVLLVIGTLAQSSIGLYGAQEKYFSSWITLVGVLPLPGGRLTMLVVFINLLAYLVQPATWTARRTGLLVAHAGALLLLVGGMLTAYFSNEGNMMIAEGETSNFVADDRQKELAFIDTSPADHDAVRAYSEPWLEPGRVIKLPVEGVTAEILHFYPRAQAFRRDNPAPAPWRGLGRIARAEPVVDSGDDTLGAAAVLRITGAGESTDGQYLAVENARQPDVITVGDKRIRIELRRERRILPFSLELVDFEKKVHPGTRMASAYSSTVNLIDSGTKRRVVISMNEPLRHRGYTFYQSSYIEGTPEITVLAVVKNYGRLFPYISSLVMCLGLLIHLAQILARSRAAARKEAMP